jgi:hypothetical protein
MLPAALVELVAQRKDVCSSAPAAGDNPQVVELVTEQNGASPECLGESWGGIGVPGDQRDVARVIGQYLSDERLGISLVLPRSSPPGRAQ